MTAPAWFLDALTTPYQTREVRCRGAAITYLDAGPRNAPPLVFVHGGTAHAHWWWPIAARFAATHRVLVPDLSGHGASDHRERYSFDGWADELATVTAVALEGTPATFVGHSIGGLTCMALAAEHPTLVSALVACDTLLVDPDATVVPPTGRPPTPSGRVPSFATAAEARARFRTIPAQTDCAGYVLDHVVPHSLRADGDRWVWSFDRGILSQFDNTVAHLAWPWLRRITCPIGYLRSEHGLVPPEIVARLPREVPGPVHLGEVPGAGHHAMLDRPEELHTALVEAVEGTAAARAARRPRGRA